MFIQTEATPNPESLKFLPGTVIVSEGVFSFSKGDDCSKSLLARQLLNVEGVENVFFGYDFITITKNSTFEWLHLKPLIIPVLLDYFSSNRPVMDDTIVEGSDGEEDADPIIRQIKDIIELRVRPAVAQDGGDITFDRFEEGIVYLTLRGACSGCPSSSATLKAGIENMLRYYVPEVLEVRAA